MRLKIFIMLMLFGLSLKAMQQPTPPSLLIGQNDPSSSNGQGTDKDKGKEKVEGQDPYLAELRKRQENLQKDLKSKDQEKEAKYLEKIRNEREAFGENNQAAFAAATAGSFRNGELHLMGLLEMRKAEAEVLVQKALHEENLAKAKAQAQEYVKGVMKASIDFIKNDPLRAAAVPALILVAGSFAFFTAKYGLKIIFDQVEKYLTIPTLAQKTNIKTCKDRIIELILSRKNEKPKLSEIVFSKEFKLEIEEITRSLKNTAANDGYFENMLFDGPPGTGKTLSAITIAEQSGLDYIYFAASGLSKLKLKDALNKLAELFDYAKRSSRKLMIIIDECEVLFKNRNSDMKDHMRQILNYILSEAGANSRDFVIVGLTNSDINDLDEAILSRFGIQLRFGAPSLQQRKEMLKLYIDKHLRRPLKPRIGFIDYWLGEKKTPKPIVLPSNAFNIDDLAGKMEGFVGRDIDKFILAIKSKLYASPEKRFIVTKQTVESVLNRILKQKERQAAKDKKVKSESVADA